MKYLEYPELELLSRALTFESAECKVFTRMEAYSCKTVTQEKRLFKSLESSYLRSASTSPPDYLEEALASPFGRLDQPAARKTLFLLIATLNVAFPDHDFSEVNPSDFRREVSPAMVLNSLSTTLLNLKTSSNAPRSYSTLSSSFEETNMPPASSSSPGGGFSFGPDASRQLNLPPLITHPALSSILDDIMCVSECDVFTFHPDMDSDPHASAEPEEEGEVADDDPYDEYWDGDDADMRDEGTPRRRDDNDDDDDDPMFDEDMYGGGLGGNASGASMSSGPRTPGNNSIGLPSRNFFSKGGDVYSPYDGPSSFHDDDDDLDGTGAGLLWSTFAFFYNRKMKRILFVSVWSRKNSRFGLPSSSWGYPQPNSILATTFGSPTLAPTPATRTSPPNRSGASSAARPRGAAGQKKSPPRAGSPAKRAIARTDSTSSVPGIAGRGRHSRAASGSPAPSAMSPFPHASPRAPTRVQDATTAAAAAAGGSRVAIGGKAGASNAFASLDGAVLSASAPAVASSNLAAKGATSPTGASKRSHDASQASVEQKRARKQPAA